jgi:hypothetical protein
MVRITNRISKKITSRTDRGLGKISLGEYLAVTLKIRGFARNAP